MTVGNNVVPMRKIGQRAFSPVLVEAEGVAQRKRGLEGGAEGGAEGERGDLVDLPLLVAEPVDGVAHVMGLGGVDREAKKHSTKGRPHCH